MTRDVRRGETAAAVAQSVARALVDVITSDISARDECHVVLTGGTVGIALLRDVPTDAGIDWSRVHFWWGDERFVSPDSPDRNDGQAWDALLSRIDVPTENIHRMPARIDGVDLDAAARAYTEDIAEFFGADFPHFDVVLLGVGPDAHVASLFPGLSGVTETGRTVIPVRDSPKPPPERVSLSLPSINSSRRVWIVAAGADKATAVAAGLGGVNANAAPVSAVRGVEETVFFIDDAAAGHTRTS